MPVNIDGSLVRGSWRRLVYGQQAAADGTVDRNAYVFCVLVQFHRHLKRRDVYAPKSSRWRDPRAQLLSGEAWANAKGPVLRALGLPEDPTQLIDSYVRSLDAAYRQVASRIDAGTEVTVDDDGRLHLSALEAIPDPPSLTELRKWFGQLDDSNWSRRDSARTGVWIGGCKAERDEQGRRGIEWGGGVEASMLADPHPRLSFDRRPTPAAGCFRSCSGMLPLLQRDASAPAAGCSGSGMSALARCGVSAREDPD